MSDWLDPPDPAAAYLDFVPQPAYGSPVNTGTEVDFSYGDSPSSTKVDSKRIPYKLPEKSRRNRLTIAIRKIQKLLPSESDDGAQSPVQAQKEADYVVRPGVPSSKLDVEEMAVGFIKDLKGKNREMARRLREVEGRLEECRCRRGEGEAAAGLPIRGSATEDSAS